MTDDRKRIGAFSFLLMAFTAVFAFNNIIDATASIGMAAVVTFLIATVFYFIPFALMTGEFASANSDSESGVYSWIRTSMGEKWAFLGAWSYFFVNLFFFSKLLPQTLIYASYTFVGENIFVGEAATTTLSILSILLFWASTFVAIKGVTWISRVTDASGVARVVMGIGFIVFALAVYFILKEPPAQDISSSAMSPNISNWNYFATLAWILQAVGGAEALGIYVKDLKGGNKTFVKTIVIAAISIGILYALGALAVGLIMPADALSGNYSEALFEAFIYLGAYFGIGEGIVHVVGLIMLLSGLGSLVIWSAAPVKVLFSEIPEGIFGKWVSKTNHEGNPTNALILQAAVVTVLLIIPALGVGQIDSFLKTLINMSAATSLIPVLFLLIAYIKMRVNKDHLPRSFRMGGRRTGITLGVMLLVFFLFAFFVSTFPSPAAIMAYLDTGFVAEGEMNPLFSLLYNVLGVIVFLGFAMIFYKRFEKNQKTDGEK